jgi:hypothetical protein
MTSKKPLTPFGRIYHGLALTHNRVKPGELHLVYSSYWHRWARVLYDFNGTFVEVDLTPINPSTALNWEKTKNANIRRHCTARDDKDMRYACVQPGSMVYSNLVEEMSTHLSKEKIAELLHREFLSEIDWDKYSKYTNGGVFFRDCMKTWS